MRGLQGSAMGSSWRPLRKGCGPVCQTCSWASISEEVQNVIADRERRGEPGRFDAEEVHQSRHTVVPRPLDQEIARWLALRLDLGSDAGIRRLEGAVLEMRPVAADGFVEDLRPLRIHVVIDALDPLDVRTEPRLAGKVEREVDSQSRGLGGRIDQAR